MSLERISILGCGYLGFPLALRLIENQYTVLGSTTSEDKLPQLQAAGIQPFYLSFDSQKEPCSHEEFFQSDVLFLNIPFRRQLADPWDYQKQIQQVLRAAKAGTIKRILFASSTSIYPSLLSDAREEVVIKPENNRAKVLLAIERELLEHNATILRFAGLYGYSRIIGKFLSGKKNIGNGKSPVNLVHLDDCVAISQRIIERRIEGEVFNVCSDEHPSREELYNKKAIELGLDLPQFDSTALPATKCVSNKKLKQALQYSFIYPNPLNNE